MPQSSLSAVSHDPPARVAIVGAGHSLIAADRVGPRVLDLLAGRYGPRVELHSVGTSGLALLDYLDHQDLLIVVDACVLGGAPGQVHVIEPDLGATPRRESSVHQIGPIETLIVAAHLFPESLPRRVLLLLVETNGLDEAALEAACQGLLPLIDDEVAGRALPRSGPRAGRQATQTGPQVALVG